MNDVAYVLEKLPDLSLGEALRRFEGLTFPPLERRADLRQTQGRLVAVVAHAEQSELAGLGLAERRGGGQNARVLSLAVSAAHRGAGLGGRLLESLELQLRERGEPRVEGLYRTSWASRAAIESLLAAAGWAAPRVRFVIGRGSRGTLGGFNELAGNPLPEGMEIFSWAELSREEEAEILLRQEESGWYPEALSPFQVRPRIEPEISTGLRVRGAVAGWMIVHRLDHETVQYSALFVDPEVRGAGIARTLVTEAIRRRLRVPQIQRGVFLIDARNQAMLRFANGPLAPLLESRSEILQSHKML